MSEEQLKEQQIADDPQDVETTDDQPVDDDADDVDDADDFDGDDDAVDDTDDSPDELSDDDGPDAYESEEEFLAQFDLPGKPKTLEEALTSAKEAVKKLNELQQQAAEQRATNEPRKDEQTPKETQEYIPRNVYSKQFDKLIEDGAIQGDENVKTYKYLGKVLDQASNAQTQMVEEAMKAMVGEITRVRGYLRDTAWRRFESKNKGRVDRDKLEKIMDQMGWYDYGKAFRQLAVDDPTLLKQIEKNAEKRAMNKAKKKGLAKFSNPRRSKPEQQKSVNARAYVRDDGTLDMMKLAKLPTKESDKIIDLYHSGKL